MFQLYFLLRLDKVFCWTWVNSMQPWFCGNLVDWCYLLRFDSDVEFFLMTCCMLVAIDTSCSTNYCLTCSPTTWLNIVTSWSCCSFFNFVNSCSNLVKFLCTSTGWWELMGCNRCSHIFFFWYQQNLVF